MSATTASILAEHRQLKRRRRVTVTLLCLVTFLALIADVLAGPAGLHPVSVLRAALGMAGSRRVELIIVQQIRLPQALAALVVGAFLALSGAQLQTVFNNPLAEGVTLGIAPAAAFGAAIAIVLGISLPFVPGGWLIAGNAFLLAFLATLVLMGLSSLGGGTRTLMLFGIGLVFTFNALIALLQIVASQAALQQLTFWMLGSLSGVRWPVLWPLFGLGVILIPWSLAAAPALTALRLGEERAISLGLDIRRLRLATFLRVSLMTGAAVASVGSIGFVGLVGPHIARLLVGEDHRIFLPISAISGALILLLAQLGAKLVLPDIDVPTGITTALIGLPVFFALIVTRRAG
ncbi:iron ABC transporter permease [Acidisoma cellulosilytica]|uniref:Iron ABC transporter permease n=1 Tax=Acidisoma cellulosilyticum TaxID=2802395 RepID=A0A964E5T3_9PROT|nr:iron ABC transporter permease [Acidisoma cellulosilyticum]MCB8882869.1 iron ABC transporter permease [Acidisoma cellulosilyticum]